MNKRGSIKIDKAIAERSGFPLELYSDSAKTVEELLGFPLKIPIYHNKIKLADIRIEPIPNKKEIKTDERKRLYLSALTELFSLSLGVLKQEIEMVVKREPETTQKQLHVCGFMIYFQLKDSIQKFMVHQYLLNTDEDIFEMIKSEGPISLCDSKTQRRLNEWLSNKRLAEVKLNKLKDALLEYALGASFKSKSSKMGRPEIGILRKFGTEFVRKIYKDIRAILKIAKKYKSEYQNEGIVGLILSSHKKYLISYKEELESDERNTNKEMLKQIDQTLDYFEDFKGINPIAQCINGDKDLRQEFEGFKWYPNQLAKKVIARLLVISNSKVEKILYKD